MPPYRPRGTDNGDGGLIALVRQTADGLGQLVAEHVKLAKLELLADAKSYGRPLVAVLLLIPILLVGYGLACLAVAVALGRAIGLWQSLALLAAAHLIGGGIAVTRALARLRRVRLMDDTVHETAQTVSALAQAGDGVTARAQSQSSS